MSVQRGRGWIPRGERGGVRGQSRGGYRGQYRGGHRDGRSYASVVGDHKRYKPYCYSIGIIEGRGNPANHVL